MLPLFFFFFLKNFRVVGEKVSLSQNFCSSSRSVARHLSRGCLAPGIKPVAMVGNMGSIYLKIIYFTSCDTSVNAAMKLYYNPFWWETKLERKMIRNRRQLDLCCQIVQHVIQKPWISFFGYSPN